MQDILENFCYWSGQQINSAKSRVFFSKNTDTRLKHILSDGFDIQTSNEMGKYLGMPILHGRVTKATFQPIVDKIKNRLST